MKNDLVCQLNIGHKIGGAVSVITTRRNVDEAWEMLRQLIVDTRKER